MLKLSSVVLLSTLFCLAVSATNAQQYTVGKIVFDGQVPYSQASLEAASGVKIGSTITKAALQDAAQKLIDTGAFGDLQSSLDGPIKSVSVVFKIKPADPSRMLTVSLANFVWYTPEELRAELQRRVPLFNGTVPEAGNLQDAVTVALQQMLADKNVEAKISVEAIPPSTSQPLRLAEYRVDSPDVRVHSVILTGGLPIFAEAVDKTVNALTNRRYNEGLEPLSLPNFLLIPYKNAGYLNSSLSGFARTVSPETGAKVEVDVHATINPGDPYKVSSIAWSGSPMMSSAEFASVAKLHAGDIASQKALLASLDALSAAYRKQGYLDVAVIADPKLDTTAHTVSYSIAVAPGAQYKLHSVTTQNLSSAQKSDFDRGWKMQAGDVYNESYVTDFFKNNTALQSFNGYSASFKTVADPDNHTVDLTIIFIKSSR